MHNDSHRQYYYNHKLDKYCRDCGVKLSKLVSYQYCAECKEKRKPVKKPKPKPVPEQKPWVIDPREIPRRGDKDIKIDKHTFDVNRSANDAGQRLIYIDEL